MRGEVIKADTDGAGGLIAGADNKRYAFSQVNVRDGVTLVPGQSVDFIAMGDEARDVYLVQVSQAPASVTPPSQTEPSAPPELGTATGLASAPAVGAGTNYQQFKQYTPPYSRAGEENLGMWTYFIRAITKDYVNFQGRARRKEYWSFVLFSFLGFMVLYMLGMTFLGIGSGGFEGDTLGPMGILGIIFMILLGLLWLAMILPSIAISVRRLHDLNQSGWMYLLSLIPYVGGLVLFVFMVLDSKPGRNIYGVSPKYPMGEGQVGAFD